MLKIQRWLVVLILIFFLIFFVFFTLNQFSRTRRFLPDSFNYVDVAQNISEGKGIVQSTLGFNQIAISPTDSIPTPFTVQAPLYPVLIAFVSLFGVSHLDAALLITSVTYGLLLIAGFLLAKTSYDLNTALLVTAFLLFYGPIVLASEDTRSEALSLLLIFIFLLSLFQFPRIQLLPYICFTGLLAGLVVSTRYALIPIALPGVIYYWVAAPTHTQRIRATIGFLLGYTLLVGGLLLRNLTLTGHLLPAQMPSNIDLFQNSLDALHSLMEWSPFSFVPFWFEGVTLGAFVLLITIILKRSHRLRATLKDIFIVRQRYILLLWTVAYLAVLVYLRTTSFFDRLSPRLVVPGAITLLMLWAALIVSTFRWKTEVWLFILLLTTGTVTVNEFRKYQSLPATSDSIYINASPRLQWVRDNTTDADLIIGDDTIDIAALINRPALVSFSPYPYTLHRSYAELIALSNWRCHDYAHIFLVLRDRYGDHYQRWQDAFGIFIADIATGKMDNYQDIIPLEILSDGLVFQVQCQKTT